MAGPIDGVLALHNAFRRDITIIDAAEGEDAVISPLLESVAPSVYETYERNHRALDAIFEQLSNAVTIHDPIETARATKAFKFHLDVHLDKEDAHMYRIIGERVSPPEQGQAIGEIGDDWLELAQHLFELQGAHS